MIQTTARNSTLTDLVVLLQDQHARQLDVVAPATSIRSRGGNLHIKDAIPADMDLARGVAPASDGVFTPSEICDQGVAGALGIGTTYMRKLRAERVDLLDYNVNAWLHGRTVNRAGETEVVHAADSRSFLVRCFRGDGDRPGIARAFLSNSFRPIDNLDVLMAALDGCRTASEETGQDIQVVSANLSERGMAVKILAPGIAAAAPTLFEGYRSPWRSRELNEQRQHDGGRELGVAPDGSPIVFAGFMLTNSETGHGAYTLRPYVEALVCQNGMTLQRNVIKAVHLGSRLEDGVITWSEDTKRKQVELIQSKTRDAVSTFLSQRFLDGIVREVEAEAGTELHNPAKSVEVIAKRMQFSKGEQAGILDFFTRGGQMTAGGVLNALTAYAQTVPDPDRAGELEGMALETLRTAARLSPAEVA